MEALRVNEMIAHLRTEMSALVASEVQLSNQNESIRSRVFIFGIVSVIVMAMSTFM